jgi:hypothetical protein
LESDVLNVPEVKEFLESCYGDGWGLRPCPIFNTVPYTIISKNICMNLGLDAKQIFQFTQKSTTNSKIQDLMFKLKPNHHLTEFNHISYYNRYNGVICLEPTTSEVHYNAQEYLLLYAPLLVVHNRADMMDKTANICFETSEYLELLHFALPGRSKTIREYDAFAAKTNQLGIITHHGHPNPIFVAEEKDINPSYMGEKEINARYMLSTTHKQHSNLDGTLFKLFPSFLFRRNWFIALGNKREKGSWNGACKKWIKESSLNAEFYQFLLMTWIPERYINSKDPGIDTSALNRRQNKFIQVNMKLFQEFLQEPVDSSLIKDDFLPSQAWDKLLKRRVLKKSMEEDIKTSLTKSPEPISKHAIQKNTKSSKSSKKQIAKTLEVPSERLFHILPPEYEQKTSEDILKSHKWLTRIHEHMISEPKTSQSLSTFLENMEISMKPLQTFKQVLINEISQ